MKDLLSTLKDTPVPTLLILAGIFFLMLSVVTRLGGAIEVSPSQQKLAIPIGLFLLSIGIALNFQIPSSSSSPSGATSDSAGCGPFLKIGKTLNWKIVNSGGIVNAGTLQVIAVNEAAREWEAEQVTQTKENTKVFLKGTFSDSMISLNRGDTEKWLGECKGDRISGKIKTSYAKDMSFEMQ